MGFNFECLEAKQNMKSTSVNKYVSHHTIYIGI